jgi:hypothetical protein
MSRLTSFFSLDDFVTKRMVLFTVFFLLLYRLAVLVYFGWEFVDSDEVLLWQGVRDFAIGEFHEPRFYGQAYSSMLESLVAVPFYLLGMPLYIALPISTTLLCLFPFLILARVLYKYKSKQSALLVLLILFLLPVEYDILTTMSRGFVTGLAVGGLCFLTLFKKDNWLLFCLTGFALVLSFMVNPNALLLTVPVVGYQFLQNFKNKYFYFGLIPGVLIGCLLYFAVESFYEVNPQLIVHSIEVEFNKTYFFKGIQDLGFYFDNISPFVGPRTGLLMAVPVLLGVYFLIKKNWKKALVILFLPVLWLLPMFASKIHDGTESLFFSSSRMFLAIPLCIGFVLVLVNKLKNSWVLFFIVIGSANLVYKVNDLQNIDQFEFMTRQDNVVGVKKSEVFLAECKELRIQAMKHKVDLILIGNFMYYDMFNYGCEACEEKMPPTLRPEHERRTWRFVDNEFVKHQRILILEDTRKLDKEFDFVRKNTNMKNTYLIDNNEENLIELLNKMRIYVRPFKKPN